MPHSKSVQDILDALTEKMYGITLSAAVADNVCVQCKEDVSELDGADKTEYLISGLCPDCFDGLTYFEED